MAITYKTVIADAIKGFNEIQNKLFAIGAKYDNGTEMVSTPQLTASTITDNSVLSIAELVSSDAFTLATTPASFAPNALGVSVSGATVTVSNSDKTISLASSNGYISSSKTSVISGTSKALTVGVSKSSIGYGESATVTITPAGGSATNTTVTVSNGVKAATFGTMTGSAVTTAVTVGTKSGSAYPISARIKGTIKPTAAGYITTETGTGAIQASAASQVGTIAAAVGSISLAKGAGAVSGANVTLSDTNNSGLSVSGSGTVSASASVTTAGYAPTGTFVSSTSSASNSATKYISDLTVVADKTLNSITVNAKGSGTTAAGKITTITNNGTISTLAGTGTISSVTGSHTMTLNNGSLTISLGSDADSSATGSNPKVTVAGVLVAQDGALRTASASSTYLSTSSSGNFGPAIGVGWNSSSQYVKGGTMGDISGGALNHGATSFTAGDSYFSSTSTPYTITASNTASVSQISCAVSTAGWIAATTKTKAATGNDTKTATKYLKVGKLNNSATSSVTYTEINSSTKAGDADTISSNIASVSKHLSADGGAIIPAEGYLYINAGYYDNLKISLATLLPEIDTDATAKFILNGYKAYNESGQLVTGTMGTQSFSSTYYTASSSSGVSGSVITKEKYTGSSDQYIKKGAAGSFSVSGTASLTKSSNIVTETTNNSGLNLQAVGTSIRAGSLSGFTAGWIDSGATISGAGSNSSTTYIKGLTIVANKTLSDITINANGSGTTAAGKITTITNNGTIGTLAGTGTISTLSGTQTISNLTGTLTISAAADADSATADTAAKLIWGSTTLVKDGALITVTPTASYANANLSTYFNSGSSSDYSVSITPRYSVANAGWASAASNVAGSVGYWKIKSGSIAASTIKIADATAPTSRATSGNMGVAVCNDSATNYVTVSASATPGAITTGWIASGATHTINSDTARIPAAANATVNAGSTTVSGGSASITAHTPTSFDSATGAATKRNSSTATVTANGSVAVTAATKDLYMTANVSGSGSWSGSKTGVSVGLNASSTGSDVDTYNEALYKRMLGKAYTNLYSDNDTNGSGYKYDTFGTKVAN